MPVPPIRFALFAATVIAIPGHASARSTVPYLAAADVATLAELSPVDDRFGGLGDTALPRKSSLETDGASEARIEYDLDVAIVSDYRVGGISSSNGKPAFQANFSVSHPSGLHAGIWGSTIAANEGSDIEVDASLGYQFGIGSLTADFGAIYYLFPGVRNSSYVELQAGLSRSFGDLQLTGAVAYTPSQKNTGNKDNLYVGAEFEYALKKVPLTFGGTIGVEDGAFGNRKIDWQLGAEYDFQLARLGLAYVDATRTSGAPHSDATLVVSLNRGF